MIKKTIFSFLLMFFASISIFAQTITVNATDTPTNVVACGDPGTFKFSVFGPVAAGTKVTATLPTGVTFNSLVSSPGITATSAANVVTFTITSALAANTNKIDVQYLLNTPCTALPANPTITYAMSGATSKVVNYPTVGYSLLEVTTVTPTGATVPVFSSQNYSFVVKQSGATGVYSTNIKVLITHSTNVGITSTIGTLTAGTPTGGSQTDVLEISGNDIQTLTGGTDNHFDHNETVTLSIKATLKGCTSGETIKLQAAYGCGTSTACTTGNVTNVGLNATSVQNSSLSMTLTKQPWPGFQTANGDSAKFTLKNTGAGPAYGVAIQFGTTTNGVGGTAKAYFDYYDFKVNGVSIAENATKQDYVEFKFTSDPDGPGVGFDDLDGDGFYNDLPAGATADIDAMLKQMIDTSTPCYVGYYNTGAGTSAVDQVGWSFTYKKNACSAAVTENGTGNNTNSPFTIGSYKAVGDIIAPNDNVNFTAGSTFTAEYSFTNGTSFNTTKTVDGQDAFWRISVEVPAGVIPNPSILPSLSGSPGNSITYFGNSGNIYYYDLKPTATGDGNLRAAGKIIFPFIVSSGCNTNGVYNLKFSAALYQNATTVFAPKISCVTSPNFSLNCAAPVGLNIDNFDLKRQTFGLYGSTNVQATESQLTAINLNHYLNGDKAVAAYQMTLVDPNITAANLRFEYDKFDWLKVNGAVSGLQSITGTYVAGGITTPFNISGATLSTYYTYTDTFADNGKSGYVFDVYKILQSIGVTLSANAKINLNANLIVNQDVFATNSTTGVQPNVLNGYNTTGINTYATVTKPDYTIVKGNDKADKAVVFGYFINELHQNNNPVSIVQCNQNDLNLVFRFSSNSDWQDLFTQEIRQNAKINSFEWLIPIGLTYVPGSAKAGSVSVSNISLAYGFNADGSANPHGLYNKLTFVNSNNDWPFVDATSTFDQQSFTIKFTPNSFITEYNTASPTFKTIINTVDGHYSLNFETAPRTMHTNPGIVVGKNVTLYTYNVTSAGANLTTATNTASWPISINNTNSNSNPLPNTWIAVEVPNNNIVPTMWDGATQIPMINYGTGKYWAKVGSISAGSKIFTLKSNNFTVCGTDSFKVKVAFDCLEYPDSPDLGYALQGNRVPLIIAANQMIDMSLTTQVPALAAVSSVNSNGTTRYDICTPIDESLTITNGANGYAYQITPQITFPTGMSFVPGSFVINYNGVDYAISDPTLVSGTIYKLDISSNSNVPFVVPGLAGTSNTTDPKSFIIKYKVQTICFATGVGNYISGSRISYDINYQSGCHENMPLVIGKTSITSQAINIGESTTNKSYVNTLKTLESNTAIGNHHIDDVKEMNVKIINQGVTSSTSESIKIFLDGSYDYVANSTVIQSGNTFAGMTATDPTSYIDPTGKRVLVWSLPTGMASGKVIEYNFKVKVTQPTTLACTFSSPATMNTYVGAALICAINNQTCNLEYTTGITQEVTLNTTKPSITATIGSTSFSAAGANTNYTVNYSVTNTNTTYEVKSQLKLMLYDDANNNGVVDAGEQLLDTKYTASSILPSGTLNGVMTGSYAGNAQNYVLVVDSNPTISDVCAPVVLAVKSFCYKPANTTGIALDTKQGITSLGRAGAQGDNWPMVRKGAWTVLESQTKGFVINRLTDTQIVAIPTANLVEGMMVYDVTNKCLKLYTTTDNGTTFAWKCLNTQTCPD
jgi:hypothetical protein